VPSPHGGYSTLEALRKLRDAAETAEARVGLTAGWAAPPFELPPAQAAWILRELVKRLETEERTRRAARRRPKGYPLHTEGSDWLPGIDYPEEVGGA